MPLWVSAFTSEGSNGSQWQSNISIKAPVSLLLSEKRYILWSTAGLVAVFLFPSQYHTVWERNEELSGQYFSTRAHNEHLESTMNYCSLL